MNSPSLLKRATRAGGIELKRFSFGLDPYEDLKTLLSRTPAPVVLDIGANEGQTALSLAQMAPSARIWSFEPNGQVFNVLVERTKGNPGITPVRAAVGAAPGKAMLQVTGATVNSSLLDYDKPTGGDSVMRAEEVDVITLDQFCATKGLDQITVLKIDAQGFDLEVLKGAEKLLAEGKVSAVFVEVLFVPMYTGQGSFEDIYRFITGHGLKFCGLYGLNRERDFYIHWGDALFVHPSMGKLT